jgi:molybdate transport system substrate-binding protein
MTTRLGAYRRFAAMLLAVLAASVPSYGHASEDIFVYAAASLTNVVRDVLDVCTFERSETIKVSFAASSVLAKQIDHGAPAAVFLSANAAWMDYLERRDSLNPGSRHRVAGNRLVMIGPTASPLPDTLGPIGALGRLPAASRVAMGDPDHVPAGIYAKAALEHMGAWESVRERAARTANVRAALALVETGAAPLGIVYATDALVSDGVRTVAIFPADGHPPIVYEAALIRDRRTPSVDRLFSCILGNDASRVFARHGFLVPGSPGHADAR